MTVIINENKLQVYRELSLSKITLQKCTYSAAVEPHLKLTVKLYMA